MAFEGSERNGASSGRRAAGLILLWFAGMSRAAPGEAQELPTLPLVSDTLVRVIDHEEDRVLEVVVGPAHLRTEGHHVRLPIQILRLPITGWLHGFQWEVTDGMGNLLPRELLHHVNLIDPDHRELFFPIPRRVMAAGRETSGGEVPKLFGYPVRAGSRLLAVTMLAQPADREYPEVYVRVRLSYSREGDNLIRPRTVYPFYLDVMGPVGPKSFPIPPGGTERSWSGSPAVDGRILAIGAHLHDKARYIRLEDETDGKVVWETRPKTDERGHVEGVTIEKLWKRGGVKVRKHHIYRIVVGYDNSTGSYDSEPGMGEIGGLIMAAEESQWPKLDRDDPAYATDLKNTLEEPFKSMAH